MIVKNVPSSWLQTDGRRLDCGPYLSGALEAKVLLEKLTVRKDTLRSLTAGHKGGIFNGPQFRRNYLTSPAHGVPFLTGGDVLTADLSRLPLLSRRDATSSKLSYLRLSPGTTIISCSGAIGRMSYVRQDMDGIWSSQDVLKVIPDTNKISPGYLYAYLSSKYGVPMIVSGTYGAIIQHIEPEHIYGLPVPRLSEAIEDRSNQLIGEMEALLSAYQSGICTATELLFKSVGIKDITASEWHEMGRDLGFAAPAPTTTTFRALNFNPRLSSLVSRIQGVKHKKLHSICASGLLCRGGRYRRVDASPELGVQMIGQREVYWVRPMGRWVSKKYLSADVHVPDGTTVVAGAGTFGESEVFCRPEFISGKLTKCAYSEVFVRVFPSDIDILPGTLFAFLRSETAFRILRSICFGTKLNYPHPALLAEVPIPIPSKAINKEVNEIVIHAYQSKERAVEKEDEARLLIETAIQGTH